MKLELSLRENENEASLLLVFLMILLMNVPIFKLTQNKKKMQKNILNLHF